MSPGCWHQVRFGPGPSELPNAPCRSTFPLVGSRCGINREYHHHLGKQDKTTLNAAHATYDAPTDGSSLEADWPGARVGPPVVSSWAATPCSVSIFEGVRRAGANRCQQGQMTPIIRGAN